MLPEFDRSEQRDQACAEDDGTVDVRPEGEERKDKPDASRAMPALRGEQGQDRENGESLHCSFKAAGSLS